MSTVLVTALEPGQTIDHAGPCAMGVLDVVAVRPGRSAGWVHILLDNGIVWEPRTTQTVRLIEREES
jgi:hypothetical protein